MKLLSKLQCTLSVLIFSFSLASAQVEKNVHYNVTIAPFSYASQENTEKSLGKLLETAANTFLTGKSTTQQPQYADAVHASIVAGFSHVKRLSVVDLLNGDVRNDFYVDGTISNISTTTRLEPSTQKDKPDQTYYRAQINVTVNLKEELTGKIKDSKQFSIANSDMGWMSSTDNAVNYALERLTEKVSDYYNAMFPLRATIIEAGEVKKDKQKTAYIDLGKKSKVYEGMSFGVFEVKTIAGKEAQFEIGRVKIKEVIGDDISLVSVSKGSKEIKEALENGKKLVVSTRY